MFIGRDRELGLLLSAVARAPADGLVAVVVAGEAGIGKSRLLAEAARILTARRHRVLAVRADRLERQVPYGALATALRVIPSENNYTDGLRRDALAAVDISLVPPTDAPFALACAALTRLFTALAAAS